MLAMCVIHDKDGNIPVEWFRTFYGEERLPDFSLDHTVGVFEFAKRALAMDAKMNEMNEMEKTGKKAD